MITGFVAASGEPVIHIEVAGPIWRTVIDTGFTGDVELPEALRRSLHPRFVGRVTSQLAGGRQIEENAYLVDFPFDGEQYRAQVTFVAGQEILIGTRLLRYHRLEIDFPAKTLSLVRTSTEP
jgi:predicted aspartyl protease